MKKPQPSQVEYGPETPGYAQLNEQLRRRRAEAKPKQLSKRDKAPSQANEKPR